MNKFSNTAKWSLGDVNGDGVTDAIDFIAWNENKFMSADDVAAVPEPVAPIIQVQRRPARRATPERISVRDFVGFQCRTIVINCSAAEPTPIRRPVIRRRGNRPLAYKMRIMSPAHRLRAVEDNGKL
jgi:hypothetical protein